MSTRDSPSKENIKLVITTTLNLHLKKGERNEKHEFYLKFICNNCLDYWL